MSRRKNALTVVSALTLVTTFVLFGLAAYIHGLSSELLLEAGVFLVSVKLVLSTQKSEMMIDDLKATLDEINRKLDRTK